MNNITVTTAKPIIKNNKYGDEKVKGFVCECGEEHLFDGYVYAHWYIDLVHSCGKCRRQHHIENGVATSRLAIDE